MKSRLLLVVAVIAASSLLIWGEESAKASSLESHSRILIDGDGNFTAANGVVGGDGTASNPYIIEGWDIYVDTWTTGIMVQSSNVYFVIRNVYLHSNVANFNYGILLRSVSHAMVENNTFYALSVSVELDNSTSSAISNNAVSGVRSSIFTAGEYGIELSGSNQILVENNTVSDAKWGIRIDNSPEVTIIRNHVSYNYFPGIFIRDSHDDYVLYNDVHHTIQDANLAATYSSRILFKGNSASYGSGGLAIYTDSNVTVDGNELWSNSWGFSCGNSNSTTLSNNKVFENNNGISTGNCLDTAIDGNAVFSNMIVGISVRGVFQSLTSAPTDIVRNTIVLNGLGIKLEEVRDVRVSQNNLVNNTVQALDASPTYNFWDSGYPGGGNYWSDYDGVDNCRGSRQNICSSPDGLGDTPYNVALDVDDNYPLMSPVQPPVSSDVAIESASALWATRIQGQNETITVVVVNNGAVSERFPVTAYFNGTIIDTITTGLLSPGQSQSLSFTWSTVTVTPGNYGLYASARPVPYEISLADNSKSIGLVEVVADTTAPSWPTGGELNAHDITLTSLTLSWTSASDDAIVLRYRVYRGMDLLASLPAASLTFQVTGLYPGTTYDFTVQAGDAGNNWSTDGPGVSASTVADVAAPVWSSNSTLSSRNISPDSLVLTWTPTPTDDFAVSSYRIFQGDSVVATIPASGNSYQVGGLEPQSTYSFRVEASDPSGNWSTDGPSTTATTMPLPSVEVIIRERAYGSYFSPAEVTVGVGETVEWFNLSPFPESVVSCSPGGSPDLSGCPVLNDPSLPSFLRFIGVNQAFYFQFTVPGVYHYYNLYDTSARGTVTVVSFVPRGFLHFNATYEGFPYQGSDLTITASFYNEGNVQMRVMAMSQVSDIGTFNFSGLPLDLNPGETKTLSIVFHIPESARAGNHTIEFNVSWRSYDPNTSEWVDQTPLRVQGLLLVLQGPGPDTEPPAAGTTADGGPRVLQNLARLVRDNLPLVLSLIIAYAAIVLIAVILVIRHERPGQRLGPLGPY